MKISDLFRKRALFGVGIFCVAAIVTVGALSVGGKDGGENPDQLADLNDQNPSGDGQQVADGTDTPGTTGGDNQQVADGSKDEDDGKTPENPDDKQAADGTDTPGTTGGDSQQVADGTGSEGDGKKPGDSGNQQTFDDKEKPGTTGGNQQVADKEEKPGKDDQGAEVLSPQVIASRLTYNKADGLQWPIEGTVLIPYSPDHGVYYKTLDQFATSDAVVIASAVGTKVYAAAKGVVVSIEEDVRKGTMVTLALGNNTKLVYGQMAVDGLKVGDVVEAGECIGTVAEPTRYYVSEGANLYFQVIENEQSINPTELLR